MLQFIKSAVVNRQPAKALMRYAGIAILCAGAVVLATANPPIRQARAQFPELRVFADASLRGPLDEANVWFLYENGSGARPTYGASMALAKQIERCRDAASVEPCDRCERGVEGLSSDEPVCKALRQPVVADELEYLLLTGEIKKGAAKHQLSSGVVMVVELRRLAPRPIIADESHDNY